MHGYFSSQRACIFLQLLHYNAFSQITVLTDTRNLFLRRHGWFNFEYSLFHRFRFSCNYGIKSGKTLKLRYWVQRVDNTCTLLGKGIWDERRMRNCWTSQTVLSKANIFYFFVLIFKKGQYFKNRSVTLSSGLAINSTSIEKTKTEDNCISQKQGILCLTDKKE